MKICFFFLLLFALLNIKNIANANSPVRVDCARFAQFGCHVFHPHDKETTHPLLVFIRGLYNGSSTVPAGTSRQTAARKAISAFAFEKLATKYNIDILVSGSSHLGVDEELYAKLQEIYGTDFSYFLAAHSGGYIGLFSTLEAAQAGRIENPPSKLFMLDNFYSTIPHNHSLFGNYMQQGGACQGYLTTHNLARYQTFYKKYNCQVDGENNSAQYNHSGSVNPCLDLYLQSKPCHL